MLRSPDPKAMGCGFLWFVTAAAPAANANLNYPRPSQVCLRGLAWKKGPPLRHVSLSSPASDVIKSCSSVPASGRAVRSHRMAVAAFAASRGALIHLISTIVGVLVLIGSLFYKLPQVFRIARSRSGEGVSIAMYALETIAVTFSASYFARKAFPFSSYGELVFVMVQNTVILALIVFFEKLNRSRALVATALYLGIVVLLVLPTMPIKVLMALQIAAIPILNFSRVPQIHLNWRRKGTGELAPVTLGLQVLGNVARIFTTIASVKDGLMLVAVCVSTLFNSIILLQWLYYSRASATTKRLVSPSDS